MANAYEVAENIYLIDAQMYSISEFTSVYLLAEEKMTLVESGPSTSAEFILDGIRQLGFDPKDIAHIIVTHIHLDHAGGAGVLLKEMPQAKVLVHERGARHLVDPSRLINSVEQVQSEEGVRQYGVISPIEQERVCPVKDGDVIELSKEQKLSIIYAPGHAHHQICIYESRNKGLFTGDAVGIYFPEGEILIPTTPPPDFDLNISINTIKQLMALPTEMLLFSHFGVTRKVAETLELAVKELEIWGDVIWKAMKGRDFENAVLELKAQASRELELVRVKEPLYDHIITNFIPLCAAGYVNYYKKMGGMKVSMQEIENRQVVLNIEVGSEEMEKSLDGAYRRLVNKVDVRGFRKGKAPRIVLERYVGRDALLEEALEHLVPQVCNQAIQEQKIEAFDQPQVEILQTDPAALKVVVSLPPIVELGDYRKIRLIPEPAKVGEEEVNAVIEELRNQHSWWELVERPVCPEDLVTIEVQRKAEEGSAEPYQEEQYVVIPGSPSPMPGFAEQLIGMEKSQGKEFSLSYPSDWKVEQLAGKQYYFKVKIIEVKQKKLPEPDDEFAQSIGEGVETFDTLQDRITTNLKAQAERKARREFEQKVVEAIADLAKVEFPPVLIQREVENLLDELARRYGGGERGLENHLKFVGKTEGELREGIRPSAIKRVTQSLVLGKIAEEENIEVISAEIDARIEYLVKDTGEKVEQWREIFGSPPGRRWVEQTLLTQKTVQRVVEIARSSVPQGESNELLERREDGDVT